MLVHAGPHSMSAFRQGKLLADVQSEVPNVQEIRSFFVHFVRVDADACAALDAQGRKAVLDRIDRLLSYGTSQENTFSEVLVGLKRESPRPSAPAGAIESIE